MENSRRFGSEGHKEASNESAEEINAQQKNIENEPDAPDDTDTIMLLGPQYRELIEGKLQDYVQRKERQIRDAVPMGDMLDTLYKIDVAQAMLQDGMISKLKLTSLIEKKYKAIDQEAFNNAFNVIGSYGRDGGKDTRKKGAV